MSIHSPLKDGLYIRPIRPDRYWIRLFIKNYPYVVGILISVVIASSLIVVDKILALIVLTGYWAYIYLRTRYRENKKWGSGYSQIVFQILRVFGLVACVTILLYYVYNRTSYLNIIQDDTLWLLYFPAISVTSQRGSRAVFFTVLGIVIGCLFLVHPVESMTVLVPTKWAITLEFFIKSSWLVFLSFTSYIMTRYMSDAVADLNLIIKVQNRMRELEGSLLRSKVDLNENDYLEKAVEVIKDDIFYDHVNIFRLDKYGKELVCIAGACDKGKGLARSGYSVDVISKESIIGHVVNIQKSYVSNDVVNDPHYMPHEAFLDTQAELVVPIKVRNRLYGVLDIQVRQSDYFLDQEIKAIEILANHIGWVIDNSEQFGHISWINRIVETIAAPIFTQSHLDETLQEIADSAAEELDVDLVFLYSYDPGMKDKVSGPIYSGLLLRPELMDFASVDPENVVFRLLANGNSIYLHEDLETLDLDASSLFKPSPTHVITGKPTFIKREKIKSNVIIRLLNTGQCVGILFLNFRKARTFSELEKKRYFSFAHLAALAIQKMQLQQHVIQKEKNEMSNLIHDVLIGDTLGLFKILKSIELPPEKATGDKLRKKLDLAINATENLHNDIRWINRLLQESSSDDLMLELDKLFTLFQQVFNVETETKWTGDTRLISPILARELFIVIKEALTNAVRHGRAKNVGVVGVIKSNSLNATVVDDGVGFNPKQVKRMNGLLSMKYRVEEMGGSFKLVSNPGKGTKIVISVPFHNSTEVMNG
ncbi:MAG: GAF domain-containing protein [Chloroflexi bacterium]|nr:GAF domain-containing protein [Chloroflexota bacterium]